MLCGTRSDQLRDQLLAALAKLPAPRRRKAAYVATAVATDREQVAAELLGQPDPAARAGAARLLSRLRAPGPRARQLLIDASRDDDLTVRVASRQPRADHPGATKWSCSDCAAYNEPAQKHCQNCGSATRPTAPPPGPAATASSEGLQADRGNGFSRLTGDTIEAKGTLSLTWREGTSVRRHGEPSCGHGRGGKQRSVHRGRLPLA